MALSTFAFVLVSVFHSSLELFEFLTAFFHVVDEIISDGFLSTVQSNPCAVGGGVAGVKEELATLLWPAAVV